jgi:8-oxo-dGTP diphosphatase
MKHSVGLILVEGDNVLLVKNTEKSGYSHEIYGAPAGRLEEGETEKQAAVREFFEETGLSTTEADISEFPNNFYTAVLERKEGPVEYSIRFFKVDKYSGELRPSEEAVPEWVPLERLKEMTLVANVREAVEASMKMIHGGSEGGAWFR